MIETTSVREEIERQYRWFYTRHPEAEGYIVNLSRDSRDALNEECRQIGWFTKEMSGQILAYAGMTLRIVDGAGVVDVIPWKGFLTEMKGLRMILKTPHGGVPQEGDSCEWKLGWVEFESR